MCRDRERKRGKEGEEGGERVFKELLGRLWRLGSLESGIYSISWQAGDPGNS